MERGFAVVGLGYVGLPVALALAKQFTPVIGFDISSRRIDELRNGRDVTGEVQRPSCARASLILSSDPDALDQASFFIVTVPTPIDLARHPDLSPLESACALIGPRLRPGSVVVFESTVYPGLTRDICGPLLAKSSGLQQGIDFKLGYSPETDKSRRPRASPRDDHENRRRGRTRTRWSGSPRCMARIVHAGIHRAPSIEVAEAAKVIENTQRDLNIALMNELAIIFDRLEIPTRDVLAAAGTKWNFLPFTPGLVGGHCIGVDPYYLTARAEAVGYYPEVILAGRRINDGMGGYIARRLVKLLIAAERPVKGARVGILGITFKENVPDLRNSRVPDIIVELREFGIEPMISDPHADAEVVRHEYALDLIPLKMLADLDALIVAVPHRAYAEQGWDQFIRRIAPGGICIDVKSAISRDHIPQEVRYWSL